MKPTSEQLYDQAHKLCIVLNRRAYDYIFWRYARLPYYEKAQEGDPTIARLNRLIGRARQRRERRWLVLEETVL